MKICNRHLAAVAAVFIGPVLGHATVLIDEPFTYANGALTTVSGGLWSAFSGAGTNPLQVVSGAVPIGTTGEDDLRVTGSTLGSGESLFASIDVSVSGGNGTSYFATFATVGGGSFTSRVFVTSFSGSDFTFGLRTSAGSAPVTWGAGLTFNTIYKVAVAYEYDTGISRLWVNPTTEMSTSISDTGNTSSNVGSFVLRQGGGNGVQTVDNLKVATTFGEVVAIPEPSTVVMLGVGLAGVLFAARRRRNS